MWEVSAKVVCGVVFKKAVCQEGRLPASLSGRLSACFIVRKVLCGGCPRRLCMGSCSRRLFVAMLYGVVPETTVCGVMPKKAVHGVSPAAGVSQVLKEYDPHIKVVLVDPPGSSLFNKVIPFQ